MFPKKAPTDLRGIGLCACEALLQKKVGPFALSTPAQFIGALLVALAPGSAFACQPIVQLVVLFGLAPPVSIGSLGVGVALNGPRSRF
jgi:hypothetical protein